MQQGIKPWFDSWQEWRETSKTVKINGDVASPGIAYEKATVHFRLLILAKLILNFEEVRWVPK